MSEVGEASKIYSMRDIGTISLPERYRNRIIPEGKRLLG
jgi:hypothetical protein